MLLEHTGELGDAAAALLCLLSLRAYQLGATIEAAAHQLLTPGKAILETWRQIDIPGRFLSDGILEKIDSADFVVADITRLNFNVTFEIGYGIGKQKRIILIVNEALSPEHKEITQLGIFDTIGHQSYTNSSDLVASLVDPKETSPLTVPAHEINKSAPIFVLDTLHKTDASIRIISKIKKSGLRFRSYDPKEQSRLSTLDAYKNVSESLAVVLTLLSKEATDARFNNLRGAFLAGIGFGLDKDTLIFQEADQPVPLDYRDFVSTFKHPHDVDRYINDLVPRVAEGLQTYSARPVVPERLLSRLDLGDPAAENEATQLAEYYLATDEFRRVLYGGIQLVVGRKGSGKTALFFRVRDILRSDKARIVLDLKPEGHQLKRFREMVLGRLSEAVQEHATAAFWEYVLLLEISYKVLEKDRKRHVNDHTLYEGYRKLEDLYARDELTGGEADFSERMIRLVHRISEAFLDRLEDEPRQYLTAGEVTQLIFKTEIPELRDAFVDYLHKKKEVVVLFDNIDKSWPTHGIGTTDIMILRGLLDASRKLEQMFQEREIDFGFTIFLRNDVYEFLVSETSDRGKESVVSLDWTDNDRLREVLRLRLTYKGLPQDLSFYDAWREISVSHRDGEDTSEYLISRSLMRPRYLLRLINYCKGNAVNLSHDKFTVEDIDKAVAAFSADSIREIGLELRDVFPAAEDVLYEFIGAKRRLTRSEIEAILDRTPLTHEEYGRLVEALMWFGFIGVLRIVEGESREVYIYDVYYDMKKLQHLTDGAALGAEMFCCTSSEPFGQVSNGIKRGFGPSELKL